MTVADMKNKVLHDLHTERQQAIDNSLRDIHLVNWMGICESNGNVTNKFKTWLKDKSNQTNDKEYSQYLYEIAERGYF